MTSKPDHYGGPHYPQTKSTADVDHAERAALISDVVRFCKTHGELYSMEANPGSVRFGGCFLTIEKFTPRQLDIALDTGRRREERIAIWTAEAIKRFGGGS
jgi:hypothetical protein